MVTEKDVFSIVRGIFTISEATVPGIRQILILCLVLQDLLLLFCGTLFQEQKILAPMLIVFIYYLLCVYNSGLTIIGRMWRTNRCFIYHGVFIYKENKSSRVSHKQHLSIIFCRAVPGAYRLKTNFAYRIDASCSGNSGRAKMSFSSSHRLNRTCLMTMKVFLNP